jgi:hypothetical protein
MVFLAWLLLRKISWNNILKAPGEVITAGVHLGLTGVLIYYQPNFFAGALKWALVFYVVTLWPFYALERGTGAKDIYPWYPALGGFIAVILCFLQFFAFFVPIVTGFFASGTETQSVGIDFGQYQEPSGGINWAKNLIDTVLGIFPQIVVYWEKFLGLFGLPPIGVFGDVWKTVTLLLSSIIFVMLVVSTNIIADVQDRQDKKDGKEEKPTKRSGWKGTLELMANFSELKGNFKKTGGKK